MLNRSRQGNGRVAGPPVAEPRNIHGGRAPSGRGGLMRVATLMVVALVAALFGGVSGPQPAGATVNPDQTLSVGGNTFFAYVGAGEALDVSFVKSRNHQTSGGSNVRFTVADATGAVLWQCEISAGAGSGTACEETGLTGAPGVWTIVETPLTNVEEGAYLSPASNSRFDWQIDVVDAGTALPGRVWVDTYLAYDLQGPQPPYDLTFWAVSQYGAQYEISANGFVGGGWGLRVDPFGVVDPGTCDSLYRSTAMSSNSSAYPAAGDACGDRYRMFFEPPAADLPGSAPSADGEMWIVPDVVTPEIEGLTFTAAGGASREGTFSYDLAGFTGSYELRIDVDGDGDFDGERDRIVPLSGASGAQSYAWDGLDGTGAAVDVCEDVAVEVAIDRTDEVHFVLGDAEGLAGGLQITQLVGNSPGTATLYWDDTQVPTAGKTSTTPQTDGTAGVDSTGGVHGWASTGGNPWGNQVAIDNWTFSPVDVAQQLALPGSCLQIEKTSDATGQTRVGDTVTYTVTATNTGENDFTADEPAVVFDDLSGVLDDGTYNDDATADVGDDPSFVEPSFLRWQGPLGAGESVEISYTVTLTAGGDGVARNVAWAPLDPPPPGTPPTDVPECDPADADGRDPVTGEACASTLLELPRLSIDKISDVTELPGDGGVVTYTVTIANAGPGATTVEDDPVVDDLSGVLDDGAVVEGSLTATTGTAVLDAGAEQIAWTGALAAGETAEITYQVAYDATAGDHELVNVACLPASLALDPGALCSDVVVPGAALQQSKSSDPSSGTSVTAGDVVTYTLHFDNSGLVDAVVDTGDDLSGVLDDADLVDGSLVVDAPLEATLQGEELLVTGTVPAGESLTVTYQVQVRDYDEQGDHVLGNVLDCPDGAEDCATTHPIRELVLDKESSPSAGVDVGDTVTYTITVTNIGAGDYDGDTPASITDDLSGVLDDATYNGDVAITTSAGSVAEDPVVDGDELTWSGPLLAGEVATITYSVTVTSAGDNLLDNVVCETGSDDTADCAAATVPLPDIGYDKSSDPEPGSGVVAGDAITYTLTFTNTGLAPGSVNSTDDLTEVLDDATVTDGPSSDTEGVEAEVRDEQIRIVGVLEPGRTAVITYEVTVGPDGARGDNVLTNVLVPDAPVDGPPPVEHPVGELQVAKHVDPASGTTVQAGAELTYTLLFTNVGQAPVGVAHDDVLLDVLDDAEIVSAPQPSDPALGVTDVVDGRITITGSLEPGQQVEVGYVVRVLPDGQRGDDRLGNHVVPSGEEPPETCDPQPDELPTCTVNHVSAIDVVKSADPESGTEVEPGQRVTYTLTFTNVSADESSAPATVEVTDHLADVLDDAELTDGPASSAAGLTARLTGDEIRIVGELAPGERAEITYTVRVLDDAEQGDRHLGNVVAITGEEPICVPDSPLCTSHDVSPPAPGLPDTGVRPEVAVALALALLVLVSGAVLVAVSRRRGRGSA